mmetsp:Transcript_28829/g.68078  ORF Transcript_28829/g.68078 Transcript_28829/m.68078 type:complete len:272 (-) Transcript_28829:395-1210(-)
MSSELNSALDDHGSLVTELSLKFELRGDMERLFLLAGEGELVHDDVDNESEHDKGRQRRDDGDGATQHRGGVEVSVTDGGHGDDRHPHAVEVVGQILIVTGGAFDKHHHVSQAQDGQEEGPHDSRPRVVEHPLDHQDAVHADVVDHAHALGARVLESMVFGHNGGDAKHTAHHDEQKQRIRVVNSPLVHANVVDWHIEVNERNWLHEEEEALKNGETQQTSPFQGRKAGVLTGWVDLPHASDHVLAVVEQGNERRERNARFHELQNNPTGC